VQAEMKKGKSPTSEQAAGEYKSGEADLLRRILIDIIHRVIRKVEVQSVIYRVVQLAIHRGLMIHDAMNREVNHAIIVPELYATAPFRYTSGIGFSN
jgi:hypothetical protein